MSNTNSAGVIPASEPPLNAEPESTFIEPLCDPIGFSQHKGECWSDSILEAFLFADGFKDVVQPLLYNTFTNDQSATEYLESKFPNSKMRSSQKRQLMNIAKRFKYHYDILKAMYASCNTIEDKQSCIKSFKESVFRSKKKISTCGFMTPRTRIKAGLKREISEHLGPAIATNIRNTYREAFGINASSSGVTGGTIQDTILYLSFMIMNFELDNNYSIYLDNRTFALLSTHSAIKDTINEFAKAHVLYKRPDSSILVMQDRDHAIAIFKCNNTWYLYDNNQGIFKLMSTKPVPNLLNIIIESKNAGNKINFVYGYDPVHGPVFIVKLTKGQEKSEFNYFYPDNLFLIGTNTTPIGAYNIPNLEGGYKKRRGRGSKRKTRKARRHRRSR